MSFLSWLLIVIGLKDGIDAPRQVLHPQNGEPESPATRANGISGRLIHRTIYVFGATQSGKTTSTCRLCGDPSVHVFSNANDDSGKSHRCCLRCLEALGGRDQVEVAAKRSKYARRVLDCIDALNQLKAEFPDQNRRPLGEKALQMEISLPFGGYDRIESVLEKIRSRNWTSHDMERINGTKRL